MPDLELPSYGGVVVQIDGENSPPLTNSLAAPTVATVGLWQPSTATLSASPWQQLRSEIVLSGDTSLNGNTTVQGNLTTTGDLTITGDLRVLGNLVIAGDIKDTREPEPEPEPEYLAQTDWERLSQSLFEG